MRELNVGTSGWSYDNWKGDFYFEGIDKSDMLPEYVKQFNSVEINATFYRIPFENMVKGWREKAPAGFRYSVKGPRQVTHYDRLEADPEYLDNFFDRIEGLGEHLGPVLWQLPPSLGKDIDLLDNFLNMVPSGRRHAVEFRNHSWFDDDEVSQLLEEHQTTPVWVSSEMGFDPLAVTGDFIYLRFHGLEEGYSYDYEENELEEWVDRIFDVSKEHKEKEVFAYFNNTDAGDAPQNAKTFRNMLQAEFEED